MLPLEPPPLPREFSPVRRAGLVRKRESTAVAVDDGISCAKPQMCIGAQNRSCICPIVVSCQYAFVDIIFCARNETVHSCTCAARLLCICDQWHAVQSCTFGELQSCNTARRFFCTGALVQLSREPTRMQDATIATVHNRTTERVVSCQCAFVDIISCVRKMLVHNCTCAVTRLCICDQSHVVQLCTAGELQSCNTARRFFCTGALVQLTREPNRCRMPQLQLCTIARRNGRT
jgi:hypothetical protein